MGLGREQGQGQLACGTECRAEVQWVLGQDLRKGRTSVGWPQKLMCFCDLLVFPGTGTFCLLQSILGA